MSNQIIKCLIIGERKDGKIAVKYRSGEGIGNQRGVCAIRSAAVLQVLQVWR